MTKLNNVRLVAEVRVEKEAGSKFFVSHVTIRVPGQAALAYKKFNGTASERWALQEFRKKPKTFALQPGWSEADMLALAQGA